jgi:hypothetical protein
LARLINVAAATLPPLGVEEAAVGCARALVPEERLVEGGPVDVAALEDVRAVIFGDQVYAVIAETRRRGAGHLVELPAGKERKWRKTKESSSSVGQKSDDEKK